MDIARRTRWIALLAALAALSVLALARPALAQPAPTADAEARAHLEAGKKAAASGDFAKAADEMAASQAAKPSAAALLGLGDALYRLDRSARAYDTYAELLRDHAGELAAGDERRAEERKSELAKKTGYLSLRIAQEGAEVSVDGQSIGLSPVPVLYRTLAGDHRVRVEKAGFATVEKQATVPPDGKLVLSIALEAGEQTARVEVRERDGKPIDVLVDGKEVGPAPWAGEVEHGTHEIGGRGDRVRVEPKTVRVEGGVVEVLLEARRAVARLEIHTADGAGTISLDGQEVGAGSFGGEVSAGSHEVVVTHDGFETFSSTLELEAGQVLAATVALRPAVGRATPGDAASTRLLQGIYGGVDLGAIFQPGGAGSSLEASCDKLGATSCAKSPEAGPSLGLFLGYALDPIAFELWGAAMGDFAEPSASFDGVSGAFVNPLVARPARDESFFVARAGFATALRLRVTVDLEAVRLAFVGGVGLAYRTMWMRRDTVATDGTGAESTFVPDSVSYLSPGLSFEAGLGVPVSDTTQLTVGLALWGESAATDARTPFSPDVWLTTPDDSVPARPQHTPAYDLARGTQLFLGPRIGVQVGP